MYCAVVTAMISPSTTRVYTQIDEPIPRTLLTQRWRLPGNAAVMIRV